MQDLNVNESVFAVIASLWSCTFNLYIFLVAAVACGRPPWSCETLVMFMMILQKENQSFAPCLAYDRNCLE